MTKKIFLSNGQTTLISDEDNMMQAACGCRVKSYRSKQCPHCKKHFCPPCYGEHIASLETHCLRFEIKDQQKLASFIALEKMWRQGQTLPETYTTNVPPLPK